MNGVQLPINYNYAFCIVIVNFLTYLYCVLKNEEGNVGVKEL